MPPFQIIFWIDGGEVEFNSPTSERPDELEDNISFGRVDYVSYPVLPDKVL